MLRYSTQCIDEDDIQEVIQSLRSDFLTQGPYIESFEERLSNYTGARYCVSVSSATAALHLACLALGVSEKSIVWTTANSFAASSNCALYCGASIDFVDISLTSYNMCTDKLEEKLHQAEKNGVLPDVLIPVHFAGQSCDMKTIHALSRKYNFKIIEDASHALGGLYNDIKIGSCEYSDIAVFSFHPVKMITTGEGGAIMTQSQELYETVKLLRSHGIKKIDEGAPWEYEQQMLGYNYRLTEMQAALGLSQLKKLDFFVEKRRNVANRYSKSLSGLPLQLPLETSNVRMSFHLYVIRFTSQEDVLRKTEIFNELMVAGIQCQVHYMPIYHHPYYQRLGFKKGYCENAEKYYSEALSIPNHPKLGNEEQLRIKRTLEDRLYAY